MAFEVTQVSYQDLVNKFFENHDATTLNRQKNDVGTQYRSGIYHRTEEERQVGPLLQKVLHAASTPAIFLDRW